MNGHHKRLLMLWVPMWLFLVLVVVRLGHIQLVQHTYYRLVAEQNRIFTEAIPAQRGILVDRYGQPLVQNQRRYVASQTDRLFAPQLPLEREAALATVATQSARLRYQLIRNYLLPTTFSHVLGYAGTVSAVDMEGEKNLLPIDQVGKIGLEKVLDSRLRGVSGKVHFEINAIGQIQRTLEEEEPVSGQLVATTLDPYLSLVAQRALGDLKGSVVILDADTGQVLTLLSHPTFDPNDFQPQTAGSEDEVARQKRVSEYFADQNQVFFNRAVSGAYPPGSLFKLVTALAGLEKKVVTSQTEVEDQGILKVGEYEYANWYYTQYGRVEGKVNLERALARSNDIYFYKLAELLGPTSLAEAARLYGLGAKTEIELTGEASGLVPDPAWKERVTGESWYLGNTFHFGIGQGDILVTPLQMAQLFQAIAHQQVLCQPSVLMSTTPKCHDLGVSAEATEIVLKGMIAACSSGGTAFPFFPYNQQRFVAGSTQDQLSAGMVACKTGTAEFGGADGRGYRKTHAWFGAIVPVLARQTDAVLIEKSPEESVTTASYSGQLSTDLTESELYQLWRKQVQEHGFPSELVIIVLVESQEKQLFMEGSRDAAPVAKKIVDWLHLAPLATSAATLTPTP